MEKIKTKLFYIYKLMPTGWEFDFELFLDMFHESLWRNKKEYMIVEAPEFIIKENDGYSLSSQYVYVVNLKRCWYSLFSSRCNASVFSHREDAETAAKELGLVNYTIEVK